MYEPLKKYFTSANGEFSYDDQEKGPVLGTFAKMRDGTIKGRSGISYSYIGHGISLGAHEWLTYYTMYRFFIDHIPRERIAFVTRALIVTSTFINPYTPHVSSVDLLLEFLPSGVAMASLNIESVRIPEKEKSLYEPYVFFIVTIVLLATFIIFEIAKYGLSTYLRIPNHIIRLLMLVTSVAAILLLTSFNARKVEFLNRLRHRSQKFFNIDPYRSSTNQYSLCLLSFIGLLCLDVALLAKRLVGIECLAKPFSSSIFPYCGIAGIVISLATLVELCLYENENQHSYMVQLLSKEMSSSNFKVTNPTKTVVLILVLTVGLKVVGANIILSYMNLDGPCTNKTKLGKIWAVLRGKRPFSGTAGSLNFENIDRNENESGNTKEIIRKKVQLVEDNEKTEAYEARQRKFLFL